MDKTLRLYTYIDGVNDTPFPSEESHAILTSFQYDSKRMGGAPTISATLMHEQCLDRVWTYNVYAQFNGERYFVKQIPSSQFSNTEVLYKHGIELVSERVILDNVYFYDVVSSDADNDKPVSNSTKFTFFGDIHEFAKRLNYSLQYRKVGYSVVVDDGISSEGKMVSFEDTVFSNAIQESYNTYEIPYYFVGKVIHFGFTNNAITNVFKYGADESLLSIQKNNANYKVVTRITGTGSSDNIPYYYPNDSEQGTLTLLYNGIESNNVLIKDRVKFTNLLLENKLEYTYIPSTTKELMSGLTVQSYVDISDNSSSERVFEFSVMAKFTMPAASTINMSFVIGYNKETYVRITNSSGTEQASRTITKTADNISMQLGSGVFTLTMTARVAIPEGVDITSMAEAQEWVNNRMSASAKYTSQSSSYWTLNGTVIYLADYGLELSSGFTPTNGDYITIRQDNYIQPSDKLLPPIYRETNGKERFYEAKNNTYINPQTGEYYHFNNEFVEGNPKEHIVSFEDIKPTIKGMTNSLGYRIDMFQEFAYDLNDNDDTYPEGSDKAGEYIHPYFFAKLRKFDGEYGFNLFDHAIDEDEMTISMTSGNCGACEWVIGVDENTQKNIVQVDSNGNLYRDEEGNVLLGAPQDRQNDTQNNEVWIALKKDINTFGVIMPNATYNYKPSVNDTFVILHIDLPKTYVLAAENKLKEELIKYMAENNDEKFNFSISFSRIFFAENPDILAKLNENARLQIEYDGTTYELYVSSYSYKMSNDSPLPEIQVELSDTLTISQNALQTSIDKVEQDIMRNVGSIDWLKLGLAYFLRKDVDDRSKGTIASDKQIEVGRFVSGVSGAIIYVDKQTGQTIGELDKLYVRMKAYFEQLEIVNVNSVGGKQIISPAGAVRCKSVLTQPDWDYYRCYFLSEQDGEKIENRFKVGDQAYSSMFNAREGVTNTITNHYYWRLVVGIGEDYIDLSKTDCDTGSNEPTAGDVIVQRGNRDDIDRQNFIEFSSVDTFSPSITLYQGINNYSLLGKEMVQYGVEKTTGKAFMYVYGDMYVGNRDGSSFIKYTPETGVQIKGTLDIGTNFGDKTLKETIDAAGNVYKEDLTALQTAINKEVQNLQSQIDGAIETWFYDPAPTLENAPAKDWITDEQRNTHLGDLYYSGEGRAYRFQLDADSSTYYWNEIVDTDIKKALENAKKAQDTADGKRRVFVNQPMTGQAYDIGDIWVNATYPSDGSTYSNEILRAKVANDGTQPFDINHWELASKYTDDTVANQALDSASKANEAVQNLEQGVKDFKDNVEGAFRDGIIDESETQALDANMKQIGALKEQVEKSYEDIATNSLLAGSTELTTLTGAKGAFLTACQELLDAVAAAIADKVITDTERIAVNAKYDNFNTKYGDYNKALNACIRYVEEKLNESISTYSYLKEALKQETTIAGGLVQTTSLVLGYKGSDGAYNVMAGSNGLVTTKGGKTPAFWMGGDMIDLFDVYNSSTGEFDREAGVRYAQGMDRMDGTGYRANGNLWWDAEGRVHADPLSFFVGENTVGALLASFQVVLKADGVHPDYLIPKVPFQSLTIADTLRIGEALVKYDAANKAVYVTHPDGSTDTIGFYAEGWVSAKGTNGSSSGGGGGASALYQLIDILPNATNDGVYGATNGSVLMYNGSKWQAGSVVTDIATLTLNVNGTKLFDYNGKVGVSANIKVPTKLSELTNDLKLDSDIKAIACSVARNDYRICSIESLLEAPVFREITSTIINAVEEANICGEVVTAVRIQGWDAHMANKANPHAVSFSQLVSHPTTLEGYGIIDGVNSVTVAGSGNAVTTAAISGHVITLTKGGTFLEKTVFDDLFEKVNIGTSASPVYAIRAKYGFYSDEFVSAKGMNGSISGGGANALYQLVDVLTNDAGDGVSGASAGTVLMYNGSKWYAASVVTDIATLTINVNGSKLTDFNGKANAVANITVPTKVSQLTNDNAYITSAAIPTALKNPYALTIQANGTSLGTYDGSEAKTFNLTYANVGAAAASHTHTKAQITDFPAALKNPYALTFGSNSYDGSAAKTITAADLGALTAHQTIYALTLQRNGTSVGTYTPNKAAATLNISVPTKLSDLTDDLGVFTDLDSAILSKAVSSNTQRIISIEDWLSSPYSFEFTAKILNAVEELNVCGEVINAERIQGWDNSIKQINDTLKTKVDNAFFARVFGLLDASGNEISVNDVSTVAASIKAKFGLWTEQYLSAKGLNSSGGGGGNASALYQLLDVVPNSTGDGVHGAANGKVLMYNGSKWEAGTVVTDIATLTLNVNGTKLLDYNGKSGVSANIAIPTKVSQLTNDSAYLTSITKSMVEGVLIGNITTHTHSQYLTEHQKIYALTIQANGTSLGTYTPTSAASTINISIPTKLSAFTDDIGVFTDSNSLIFADAIASNSRRITSIEDWVMTPTAFEISANIVNAIEELNVCGEVINSSRVQGWDAHLANKDNPHGVTKAQVGLGSVDNLAASGYFTALTSTSATNLSMTIGGTTKTCALYATYLGGQGISYFATASALSTTNSNLSTLGSTVSSHTSNKSNPHGVTKAQVGLGNVDNLAASGYLTALSSSNTTNLSITIGGTTKSVASLYADYLGGNAASYYASASTVSALNTALIDSERTIAERLASIETKLMSIEAWLDDPNIRELTDFKKLFNELFDIVYSGANISRLVSRHDFASYGAITAKV